MLKKVAIRISESLGSYTAIHVRRGDKILESGFKQVSHQPSWYLGRMLPFKTRTKNLYIATDEKNRDYFWKLIAEGFHVYFWEDLDKTILQDFLGNYPSRMFMDILSAVEQLLCGYAYKFLGSGYSTMTNFILRIRKRRGEIAYDTTLGPIDGLPTSARNLEPSKCNPLSTIPHKMPC